MRAATAIELVHMATLVHDDVLDEAPLRRGLPTVAATSGRDRAVATGDLLFSRAFALLADAGDAPRGRAARRRLGRPRPRRAGPAPRRLRPRDLRAALPRALPAEDRDAVRVRLPARPRRRATCGAFGAEIGLAFQLLDDVLDVAGPPERTGKARGTDLLDGTVTLPLIEAAAADPAIREVDLRGLDAGRRRGALRPDRRDRGAGAGPRAGPGDGRRRPSAGSTAPASTPEQRQLLDLVADGVVQRYS